MHLPGGGGHAVISALRDDDLATRFLALSVSDAAEDVIAVVRAGARGYVTKTISAAELVDAIERVAEGDAVFSPRLAGFVLDAFSGDLPAPADPELDQLTSREQEVLRLIARGYTYKEVADPPPPLGEDDRDPRVGGAPQAPALEPPPAHRVGQRTSPDLSRPSALKARRR